MAAGCRLPAAEADSDGQERGRGDPPALDARAACLHVAVDDFSRVAYAELLPDERIRTTLDAMGCEDIDLERAPHDLSGGQTARVALARTLLTDPKVLLADEVDAGLDDDNAAKVATIMADAATRGMAIIRIRHRPPDGRATRTLTLDKDRDYFSHSAS